MKVAIRTIMPLPSSKVVVYVENSAIMDIANQWFDCNEVYSMPLSNTWNQVRRILNKLHTQAIGELLPYAHSIRFSQKAGCFCGCSPGYIVKYSVPITGKEYWVDIKTTKEEQDSFTAKLDKLVSKLEKEKQQKVAETL